MYRSRLFDLFPFYEGTTNNTELRIDRDANEYHLAVNLTGLTKEEVSVNIEEDTIIIEGKTDRKLPSFAVKNYKNSFYAENIDADSVKSKLESGILTVIFKQKNQPVTRRNILVG
jgi:HSP20 family molecular chaperone IbpA